MCGAGGGAARRVTYHHDGAHRREGHAHGTLLRWRQDDKADDCRETVAAAARVDPDKDVERLVRRGIHARECLHCKVHVLAHDAHRARIEDTPCRFLGHTKDLLLERLVRRCHQRAQLVLLAGPDPRRDQVVAVRARRHVFCPGHAGGRARCASQRQQHRPDDQLVGPRVDGAHDAGKLAFAGRRRRNEDARCAQRLHHDVNAGRVDRARRECCLIDDDDRVANAAEFLSICAG